MSSQTPAHLENKVEDSTAGTKDKKVASSAAAAPSVAAEPAKPAPAKSAAKQPIRLKPNNPIAKIKRPVAVKSSSKQGVAADGAKPSKYLEEMERYKRMSCAEEHTDRPLVK